MGTPGPEYSVMPGDWTHLEYIINDLSHRIIDQEISVGSDPIFGSVTVDNIQFSGSDETFAADISGGAENDVLQLNSAGKWENRSDLKLPDGANIGIASDTDLLTLTSSNLTVAGDVDADRLFAVSGSGSPPPISLGWNNELGFRGFNGGGTETISIVVNGATLQNWARNDDGTVTTVTIDSGVDNFNILADTSITGNQTVSGTLNAGAGLLLSNTGGAATVLAVDGANDSLNLKSSGTGIVAINTDGGSGGFRVYDGGNLNFLDIKSNSIFAANGQNLTITADGGSISFGDEFIGIGGAAVTDQALTVTGTTKTTKLFINGTHATYRFYMAGSNLIGSFDSVNNVDFRLDRGAANFRAANSFYTAGVLDWTFGLPDSDVYSGDGSDFFIGTSFSSGLHFKLLINTAGNFGMNCLKPDATLEINAPSGGGIRLTYNEREGSAAIHADMVVDSDGNLNISSTGNTTIGDGGATNYTQISATGDLVFAGAESGLVYGGISRTENAVETVIASAGVKVQVTIFDRNAPSNNTTPDHTTDDITITIAGDYHIVISATVNSISGAGSVMELEVMKNNGASRLGDLHADRSIGGGGTERGSISLSDIVTLAVDDTIEVWIENETNTQNYIVEDITLSLFQIGGA